MCDDVRALTANAECSWAYIDRLREAHAMACKERDVVTKRMIQLEQERSAVAKCLEEIRKAIVFGCRLSDVDAILKKLRDEAGI